MGIYDRHLRAKHIYSYSPLWSLGGPFALSLAGLVAIISPNLVAAADAPNQKAPLVLKEQGSFYVGGRIVTSAAISGAGTTPVSGDISVEHIYVQYQVPQAQKYRYPINHGPRRWPHR